MLKVALIGVGGISGAHVPAWTSMEETELVAVCDIRPEQMEKCPNSKHYTDFEKMLDENEIDILDICLPTYLHVEYSLKALNRKINVICEKPISLNAEDAKLVYDTAKKNNVKFMVAQVLRFWPEYEFVKETYNNKKYGKLLSGSMLRLSTYPAWSWDNWMMDEKRSGLVPFDLHIHDLDFLIYAFGTPKKVTDFRARRPEQDYINAVYEFDGFFVTTEASWYASPYPFAMEFRFQFENAVISMENGTMKVYERNGNIIDLSENAAGDTGDINLPHSNAYANEIKYFTECVMNNKPADKVKPEELKTVIDILKKL